MEPAAATTRATISARRISILGRVLDAIDHEHRSVASLRFEFQSELLFQCGEDRRSVRIDCREAVAVKGTLQKSLRGPRVVPVERARQAGLLDEAAAFDVHG